MQIKKLLSISVSLFKRLNNYISYYYLHIYFSFPFITINFDNEWEDISWNEVSFFITCIPEEEFEWWIFGNSYGKMFFILSERLNVCDSNVFEYEEWFRIPNAEWSKMIDIFQCFYSYLCWTKGTFNRKDFVWKILYIMYTGYLFPHGSLEFIYFICFDRESSCLTMTTISHKIFFAIIEKFDEIAPFWRSTRSNREISARDWSDYWRVINRYSVSFSTGKRMIMSIFYHNGWFIVDFCETTCYKSNNSMFEIRCIIEQYWFTRIDIFESFLKMCFCSSFANFIKVFKFTKEFIGSSFSG